jgi:hypothetical protein
MGRVFRQRKDKMNLCKLGFHKWVDTDEGKVRWCKKCQKKQERNAVGKWVESRSMKPLVDESKFCQCPRDYTISIKTMVCQRCGLPRRPRVLPSRDNSLH